MKLNKCNVILFYLLLQICYSCTANNKNRNNITSLNINSSVKIDFDELVENVNCIVLENLPDAYLTDCWKTIKYKENFYIYSLSDFAVCIFDKRGKFIKRIDGKSDGAVETPSDIFIDELNEQLWIIENRHIIHKYSLTGEFITKTELPFNAVKIANLDNDYFLFYDGGFDKESSFFVRQTSTNLMTLEGFVEKKNKKYRSMPISLFTNGNSMKEVYTLLPHVDTIYISEQNNSFRPLFHLDFDNKFLTFDMFPKNGFSDKEMGDIIKKKEIVHNITGFNYASGLLFLQLPLKNISFLAIDIHAQKVYRFNTLIDGLEMYSDITTIQGSTNTSLLVSMSAVEFFNKYEKISRTRYKSIEKILEDPMKLKNRIIIEIKVKKLS